MGAMLGKAAKRHVLAGGPGERRRCKCRECDVQKCRTGQRQVEKRRLSEEEDVD